MKVELKVMTFNSRCAVKSDGVNFFWNRTDRILEMIAKESPDIIGFQELMPAMQEWYVDQLSDYTVVGIGRGKGYTGESTAIAFKKRKFFLLQAESRMLSSTPLIPGSFYEGSDQSGCPRIYTKLQLKHREVETPFWFYNLHTDHAGALARQLACIQVLQDISECQGHVIVTGDFNAKPDDLEIRLFQASPDCPLVDTTKGLDGTFHSYGRREPKEKIDYIFADPALEVISSRIVSDEGVEGVYLSDHHPVCTVFALAEEEK